MSRGADADGLRMVDGFAPTADIEYDAVPDVR
jgi:hypothetical protein